LLIVDSLVIGDFRLLIGRWIRAIEAHQRNQ
jgi:hypothetical protein